eukprot:CAMPEP_0171494068 /NCGR_PEP_ID=MMETSP0958-20121227/5309_1 /TAXON_ID=87120 /ORGANISM="Aurantiochytrium limacinum, Strain ATCCMYA-1381" /LENGTH=59 /DNA_ID=CAMNT_0012027755 /DNA_START=165 /DNA_END=344 /DNA_ORIENTATION=-
MRPYNEALFGPRAAEAEPGIAYSSSSSSSSSSSISAYSSSSSSSSSSSNELCSDNPQTC